MRLARIGCAIVVLVVALPGAALAQKAAPQPKTDPLRTAYRALETGRYVDAERGFRALQSSPQRGKALLGLGRVQLETGRYREAEQSAAAAASVAELAARAHTLRGEALYQRGRLDEAERAFG